MTAEENLRAAADEIAKKGKEYEKKGYTGERSMRKVTAAFNSITGQDMTPQQGWLFMEILKAVRLHTNPDKYHRDSALDKTAYAALEAEEWDLWQSEKIIGQPVPAAPPSSPAQIPLPDYKTPLPPGAIGAPAIVSEQDHE